MESSSEQTGRPAEGRKPKKKPSLLLITVILGTIGLVAQLVWVNWKKPVPAAEPLPPEVAAVIDRLPGTSDALIYAGLKDIRESLFWQEVIPDSLRNMDWLRSEPALASVLEETGLDPASDLDTLILAYQHQNSRKQKYLGILRGSFRDKLTRQYLEKKSLATGSFGGETWYALPDSLWISRPRDREVILANTPQLLQGYLEPEGNFLERDSTTAALIGKATYKSHFWFTLSSTYWTLGALQSLTSGNKDMKSLGNINRIRQLALSLKFDDGVLGQTEWIYENRRSAYFASTFLWAAVKLSSASGTRTSEPVKELLKKLEVMQNLQSVIVRTDLPIGFFRPDSSTGSR